MLNINKGPFNEMQKFKKKEMLDFYVKMFI